MLCNKNFWTVLKHTVSYLDLQSFYGEVEFGSSVLSWLVPLHLALNASHIQIVSKYDLT